MIRKKSGKLLRMGQCPRCAEEGRDASGDNLAFYAEGDPYCFAGHGFITVDNQEQKEEMDEENYTYQYLAQRGISREAMEYYGVETKVNSSGSPVGLGFPYGSYTVVRSLPDRAFKTVGDSSSPALFGKDKFNAGSAKAITITEGAMDALSIFECLGRKYPSVAVRSASTARQDCVRDYNYLNSFENIYICFDNDGPGQDAARDVSQLFDVNKVYHVKLDKWKDANEALLDQPDALRRVWYGAKRYQPKGVVSGYSEIEEILKKEDSQAIAHYPYPTLDGMAYGIRSGELVLFTALEKVGKTEVLRALEYNLLKTTDANIGIIHLEEQEKRSVQGLVGYELGIPAHLPDSGISLEDQVKAYKSITKNDGRLHFYSHFGSDNPDDILSLIRYLAAVAKCRFIFLDHLTMLVTGIEGDDERRKLDYISTKLARLTRELNFTLFLVSHVNDDGQTRGSRMPSKLCDLEVYLSRDKESADPKLRNRTNLMVRNNRFAGSTGPAGHLTFDPKTFRLEERVDASQAME